MADSAKTNSQCTVLVDIVVKSLTVFDADIDRLNASERKIIRLLAKVGTTTERSKKSFTELRRELNNASRVSTQLEVNLRNFASLKKQFADLSKENTPRYNAISERVSRTEQRVAEMVAQFPCKLQTWNGSLRKLERLADGDDVSRLSDATLAQQEGQTSSDALLGDAADDVAVPQRGRIALDDEAEVQPGLSEAQLQEEDLRHLARDMETVHAMYETVRDAVEVQGVAMRSIEEHVDASHENVQHGSLALRAAVRAKQAALPLGGMLLGAAVGGPMGLVVGLKVGLLAAAGGASVGYVGGRVIKNRLRNEGEQTAVEQTRLPD